MVRPESWIRSAGASPVWVIAGEPSSRVRFVVGRRRAERGVESLFGGSKRADRSAISCKSCSLVTFTTGEPRRSCHGEGPYPTSWPVPEMPLVGSPRGKGSGTYGTVWFGTGEAHLPSLVDKDCSYKPVVESSGGKRESDGVIVLMIVARNAAGEKGPDFGHAGSGVVSCEDMTGAARFNHPGGHSPVVKVRRLQDRLWATGKLSPLPDVLSMAPGAMTSHLVAVARGWTEAA